MFNIIPLYNIVLIYFLGHSLNYYQILKVIMLLIKAFNVCISEQLQ